ncbi:unnamed protein product [Ectocarpus sp. 13 AM-2016]
MSRLSYSETRDGIVPGVSEEGVETKGPSTSGGKRKRARDDDIDGVAEAEANGGSGGAASPGAESLSSYSLMGVVDGNEGKDVAGGACTVEAEAAADPAPSPSADGNARAGADAPAADDGDDEVVEIPPPSAAPAVMEVSGEADCDSGGFKSGSPGTAAAPISIESGEAPKKKSKSRKSKNKQKAAAKDLEAQQEDGGGGSGSVGSGEQRPSKKARKSAGAKAKDSDVSEGGSDDDASEGGDADESKGIGNDGDGGDGGEGGGSEGPVLLTVGQPMSKKMRKMAKGRLSKWALKFTGTRTYAPPAVPVIEPINDDYLASFGRSYAEAKSLTALDKNDNTGTQDDDDDDDDDGDGHSQAGDENGGGGDSSSGDKEGPSDDEKNDAAEKDAADREAAKTEGPGSPTKKNSLSGGRKKHGVFVVNLLYTLCDEEKLESLFSTFGRVTAVVLTRPPEGKRVAGSASVYFGTSEEAQKALAADGMDIRGRCVGIREVRLSVDKRYFVEPEQAAKATNKAKPLEATRCTLCGAIGHDDKNCPFYACSRCWEEGHLADACPYVDVMEEGPEPYCSLCGKAGHSIDACETACTGKSQLKFSCITCRDDGHTQCGKETILVFGNERGDAMTCCNCGLERHDRRSCPHQTEAEVLRECGYRFNSSAGGGNRRKSTGGGGKTYMMCYNCGKQGHSKSECPVPRQTQTPGRFGTSNNYNRNDQPRVPAADWKQEWSASNNNTLSFNSLSQNHGSGKFRNDPTGSGQQHHHQAQQPTHLPSAYLNDLAQPPSPLQPTRRDGGAAAFSGPPSPPFHHRNHNSHHDGGGYHQHQQERGGTHNRYQHQMATPTDSRSSFPRWGDDAAVSNGGSGSGTLHRAYHPGGNFGSDSSGGGGRRVEDRHRSSGHRGERYSSSRSGSDRYSGGGSSRGQKGGYHSYNRDQHQPAPTPSPSYSHHSSGSHQRSRYSSGQPYSSGGQSHSAGRRGGGTRDSHANPRSYGY